MGRRKETPPRIHRTSYSQAARIVRRPNVEKENVSQPIEEYNSGYEAEDESVYKPLIYAQRNCRPHQYASNKIKSEEAWRPKRELMRKALICSTFIEDGSVCKLCPSLATHMCITCGRNVFCKDCLLRSHESIPNHCYKAQKTEIGADFLGLEPVADEGALQPIITSSHIRSKLCPFYIRSITLNSASSSKLHCICFCHCNTEEEQLINYGYYPATASIPTQAFSLELLRFYRLLNLECQVAMYGMVNVLYESLDFIKITKKHYNELFRSTYYEYRMACFENESATQMHNVGCLICPRTNEKGEISLAMDGCFRLQRFKSAGKVNYRSDPIVSRIIKNEVVEDYLMYFFVFKTVRRKLMGL